MDVTRPYIEDSSRYPLPFDENIHETSVHRMQISTNLKRHKWMHFAISHIVLLH